MSLQYFLGKTDEIRIIDFFAENSASVYNQTEISKWTKIPKQRVSLKLGELMYNGIVEIKETYHCTYYYQLCKNDITKKLIGSVFENGLFVATKDEV